MKNKILGEEELYLAPDPTKSSFPSTTISNIMSKENSPPPKRIAEIPDLRARNLKVFRMSDGTEQAVFSPSNIHVLNDETNIYEDVEKFFMEDEDGKHFTCGKNDFVAKFNREKDTEELFFIEKDIYKVTVLARTKQKKKRDKTLSSQKY